MTTLFQLHTDLDNLKSDIRQLKALWQQGDGVVLMGQTLAFVDWVFAYVDDSVDDSEQDSYTDDSYTNDSYDEQLATNINIQAQWYGLQTDMEALNPVAKQSLTVDKETTEEQRIQWLTDEAWVTLTQHYDKVMTITQ